MIKKTREERHIQELERAKKLTEKATGNGVRITFSTKPRPGELDFAKAIRRSLEETKQ